MNNQIATVRNRLLRTFGSPLGTDGFNASRRDSRKLTIADSFALLTGFAIACALPPPWDMSGAGLVAIYIPMWFFVALAVVRGLWWLNLATTCVILTRRYQFGGMLRPAEWLGVLTTLWMFSELLPPANTLINYLVVNYLIRDTDGSDDFAMWRWAITGFSSSLVLIGLGLLWRFAEQIASWAKIIVLAAMTLFLLWGPIPLFTLELPAVFSPRDGLGNEWIFWLTVAALLTLARFPYFLLIGAICVATWFTWRRGGRRNWTWPECISASIAAALGIIWFLIYYVGSYESPPTGWISERILTTIGIILTCGIAAHLVDQKHASPAASHLKQASG